MIRQLYVIKFNVPLKVYDDTCNTDIHCRCSKHTDKNANIEQYNLWVGIYLDQSETDNLKCLFVFLYLSLYMVERKGHFQKKYIHSDL